MEKNAEENARLEALARYDILDTSKEDAFDRVIRLACRIFDVPVAAVSLIDENRQWFKSCSDDRIPSALPRGPALCNLAIQQTAPLVIPDAHADERYVDNMFVVGEPRIRFYASAQLVTPEGHNIGTVCILDQKPRAFVEAEVAILRDLAAVVMSQMELRLVAMNDSLTGALTRRAFRIQASGAMKATLRSQTDIALITFDLDHFKMINDRFGHPTGDKVLIACVETCRRELRAVDFVGRLGGEEFAVMMPGCSEADAMGVANRIRAQFTQVMLQIGDAYITFSASFGVTTRTRSDSDLDDMIKRADAALYEAKAAGRNTCRGSGQARAVRQVD